MAMRIRIAFNKTAKMRYTGHLDLHKTWERCFRRAELPLAYSQGFHPQPRLNLACALPLGFTSQAELLDVWLETEMDLLGVDLALKKALPPGISIQTITEITTPEPALQVQVQSAVYDVTLLEAVPDLDERIADILSRTTLPRERRKKQYDLRPLIEALIRLPDDQEGCQRIEAQLAARDSATGRPEEVLEALGIAPYAARVHRTQLILNDTRSIHT